jgi:NMD protein affecting ribosome stability and mRNA decay
MSKVKRRCGKCGQREVSADAAPGRVATYRRMTLEIPASIKIPTCRNCGARWFDEATAATLDDALEPIYQRTLRGRLQQDLGALLGRGVTEARIEEALGVSRGYLSRLRSGSRTPSRELVVAVAYMAKDKADPPFAETIFPGGRRAAG